MARRFLLAAALVGALAGCGGSSSNGEAKKTADQVVADAQKAALSASSVHVSGTITDNGTPLAVDLTIVKGKGGKGTLSESGLTFQLVRIGDTAYIKGSEAFLRKFAGAGAATLFHDKWLKGSASTGRLAALAPLTDAEKLIKAALGQHGTLANKGETDYKGEKVVEIDDTTQQGGRLYVAATGDPFPVALKGSTQQGSIAFDDWNDAEATVEAPKGAIDLSQLGG
jgi:hypothetical protein